MLNDEPPLHKAVISENYSEIQHLATKKEEVSKINALGFSALEVAYYLNDKRAIELLSKGELTKRIPVQRKGSGIEIFSTQEFESFFNIAYRSHLHFFDYKSFKSTIFHCPWIIRSFLGEENRSLGLKYREEIRNGFVAPVTIKWIDDQIGYGVFADYDMPIDTYIGEYTGLVRGLSRIKPDYNAYCFHYPTKFFSWKYRIIDALQEGNELRFLNHSDHPNLKPICLSDRCLLHLTFKTARPIAKDEELTFDYGHDFWKRRESIKISR